MTLNIYGSIFIGMILTGIVAFFTGQLKFEGALWKMPQLPEGILVWNPITAFGDVISYGLYGVVFAFLIVTLFDTTGTMIGVAKQAGLMKGISFPVHVMLTCRFYCHNVWLNIRNKPDNGLR